MAKKIYLGIVLVLVVLTSSIYMLMPDNVRIDFEKTRTVFKVYEDGKFAVSGIEYSRIFDGTKLMRANERTISYDVGEDLTNWHRLSKFKDNITVEDFYQFKNDATDVKDVPIEHEICFTNAEGKIFEYLVSDITYDGETKDIESPFEFGKKMKLVFQDNYYRAKVYQNKVAADKIIVRYRIDSNYQCFDVRLFDPPVYDLINPGFERIDDIGNPPNNWTYTGGVAGYESGTKHTGTYSAKITQTGGAMTYLYQNLTNLNLTNSTNYTATAYIYIPSSQSPSPYGLLTMGSAPTNTVTRTAYGLISSDLTVDTWMQVNLTFNYDNSTALYFGIYCNGSDAGGGEYVYWDDVAIYNYTAPIPSNTTSTSPSNGSIWITPKSNYSNSLWMVDFNLDGENSTAYNTSCGTAPTNSSINVTAQKLGTYTLTYNGERSSLGTSEKSRFSLYKFPRRFFENTYRVFFQLNETLTANQTSQIDLNFTKILNSTSISLDINASTTRLYHITRSGGIYNDTNLCYEQPISFSP